MKVKELLPELSGYVEKLTPGELPPERKQVLSNLVNYIQMKIERQEPVFLNFICTHNSRRSQIAQIWAQTAAFVHGIEVTCFSGGVEVTAFNERAVAAMQRAGFKISKITEGENPEYEVQFSKQAKPLIAFSKLYDHPVNKADKFAAVMTCSHADENCPFIPGTEQRISVTYDDPKEFDDTPLEIQKYDERVRQIATEMFYVFSQLTS